MTVSRRAFWKRSAAMAIFPFVLGATRVLADTLRGQLYVPRYAPSLATDGKQVYISGGAPIGAGRTGDHTHSAVLTLVEAIDPITLRQTFLANAIFPRANHASVWVNGQLWLLGGRTQIGDERRLAAEVERIDVETQAIWRGPDLPLALIDLSAVVFRESVFVFGGIYRDINGGPSKPSGRVFECAPPYVSWVERANMPVATGSMATVVTGEKIYLVGGFDREKSYALTQIFDPKADEWTLGASPPRPISAHAGAGAENRLFLFGDYQHQTSILGLDIDSGEWRDLNIPFVPRRHVRAIRVGGRIIVAGGNSSSLSPAMDALEAYDLKTLNEAFNEARRS